MSNWLKQSYLASINSRLIAVPQSQSKKKKEQTEAEPLVKPKGVTGESAVREKSIREETIGDPDMTEFPCWREEEVTLQGTWENNEVLLSGT